MNPTPADSNKVDDPAQGRLGFLAALGGLSLVWLGTFVYPLYQYLSPPPMVFGFSGYLLPWDDLSFFATRVGISEVEKAPGLGMWLANLVRGGGDVTVDTIGRFYPLHVVVMPLLVLALVTVHLLFVQVQGMGAPDSYYKLPPEKQKSVSFFGDYLFAEIPVWLLMGALLAFLATFFPRGLAPEADPTAAAPRGIKPEW